MGINEDIAVIIEKDPAARSAVEVKLLYSGYKAVKMYRRAHKLYKQGKLFRARWISQRCVKKTNIEIHPGARIGRRLFIDHGTGVVIGETTEIGDDCTIYQGVTLGGTGKHKGKRHPTLGSNVMVGAGAKVLGPITIGSNVRIAAGAVVLTDLPDNCTAVGVPARIVRRDGIKVEQSNPCVDDLDQVGVPDPVAQQMDALCNRIKQLEKKISEKEWS